MNTGIALTKPTPALRACSTYHLVASSRADRQVGDDDVDLALLEDADHVGRRAGRLLDDLAEVLAQAVVGHAALDLDADVGDLLEDVGVVRLGVDRLGQVLADLVLVDVEGGHELDVADVVAAQVDVHQARDEVVLLGVLVVVAALDQAAGAVADADDRDADLAVVAAGAGAGLRWAAGARGRLPFVPVCPLLSFFVTCALSSCRRWMAACLRTWMMRWMTVIVARMAMSPRATARTWAPVPSRGHGRQPPCGSPI